MPVRPGSADLWPRPSLAAWPSCLTSPVSSLGCPQVGAMAHGKVEAQYLDDFVAGKAGNGEGCSHPELARHIFAAILCGVHSC